MQVRDATVGPLFGTWLRIVFVPEVLACLMFLQIAQSVFVSYHAKHVEVALTVSPLRDRFSVISLASWVRTWRDGGQYLKDIVKRKDRIYVQQALAAASFTKAYLRDEFYAPPSLSKYDDLRNCQPVDAKATNCYALYDYILTFADERFRWPSHDVLKMYWNLAILKRKQPMIAVSGHAVQGTPPASHGLMRTSPSE